jgi:hypothetical protein
MQGSPECAVVLLAAFVASRPHRASGCRRTDELFAAVSVKPGPQWINAQGEA